MPDRRLFALGLLLWASVVSATEYRSASSRAAVLYDAPNANARKLYVVNQGYPAEVLIVQGDWVKLRDRTGGLAWGQKSEWGSKRTVLVNVAQLDMRSKPDAAASVVARVSRDVVLELLPVGKDVQPGWLQVRHRDGATGWVRLADIWGA